MPQGHATSAGACAHGRPKNETGPEAQMPIEVCLGRNFAEGMPLGRWVRWESRACLLGAEQKLDLQPDSHGSRDKNGFNARFGVSGRSF